jgi:hypothetical protein
MPVIALFGLSILMSFAAFGLVVRFYVWPWLQRTPRNEALTALVVPHAFRFVGLSFLVPGVVAASLPSAFAAPAAYGDLIAALLAIISLLALSARTSWALAIVWIFNLWGSFDLLQAMYLGRIGVGIDIEHLGATFYIPTVIVPPLLILHGLIFWLLLRRGRA